MAEDVTIKMSLDIARAERELLRFRRELKETTREAGGVGAAVGGIGRGLGGALSGAVGAAAGVLADPTAGAGQAAAAVARNLSSSAASMAGKGVQALGTAAFGRGVGEFLGQSVEQLAGAAGQRALSQQLNPVIQAQAMTAARFGPAAALGAQFQEGAIAASFQRDLEFARNQMRLEQRVSSQTSAHIQKLVPGLPLTAIDEAMRGVFK